MIAALQYIGNDTEYQNTTQPELQPSAHDRDRGLN